MPEQTLRQALMRLEIAGLRALRVSRWYRTPAFPAGSGPDYVNGAAVLDARGWGAAGARGGQGGAQALLALLHRIEAEAGRARALRWGARSLDLDLIALDGQVAPDAAVQTAWRRLPPAEQARRAPERLILPHPRLAERAFVLVPLAEVAPRWRHPLTGLSVAEMLAALPAKARAEVVPLPPRGR